ncbi:hypothetical protein BDZ97DRAFT_1918309 [Flammula alnicola]|nr:hypothetical protein BDZ97DRAFT_1918309 [Flammula alnicola]
MDAQPSAMELGNEGVALHQMATIQELLQSTLRRSRAFTAIAQTVIENSGSSASDAKQAVTLSPGNVQAWLHLARCQHALQEYSECVQSYDTMLKLLSKSQHHTAAEVQMKDEALRDIKSVLDSMTEPETIWYEILAGRARFLEIPIPPQESVQSQEQMKDLRKSLFNNPRWDEEPKVNYLFIPDDESQPIRQIALEESPSSAPKIRELLGCNLPSPNVSTRRYFRAAGCLYTVYEAIMDDIGVYTRPYNRRASELLVRPNTHGPILVMKSTFIKDTYQALVGFLFVLRNYQLKTLKAHGYETEKRMVMCKGC